MDEMIEKRKQALNQALVDLHEILPKVEGMELPAIPEPTGTDQEYLIMAVAHVNAVQQYLYTLRSNVGDLLAMVSSIDYMASMLKLTIQED